MSRTTSNDAYFASLKALELVEGPATSSRESKEVVAAQWNAPASRIACSKMDRSLKVWRLVQSEPTKSPPTVVERAHEKPVKSLSWKPTSETVLATVGKDRFVKVWNTVRGTLLNEIDTGEERNFIVAYSGDGKLIVSVSENNTVIVLDAEKLDVVTKLQLPLDIFSIAWNNTQASFLFIGLASGAIEVYQYVDRKLVYITSLEGHSSSVRSLVFDPKGRYLVAGSNEGVVSIWSTDDFKVVKTIGDVDEPVTSVSVSRDGTYVAAAFEDGSPLRIYDIDSGRFVHEIPRCVSGKDSFPVFAFCPIKSTYLYATTDGRIYVTYKESRKY
jgi:THO complex subunit 3